ncbi:MAG: TorF family putative porin [Sphingomonadales bacterium]|nr:TorF family putative porin [Sphingomonadales bacterium]
MNRTATLLLAAMLGITAPPALADETDPPPALAITGSAAVVSDYRFRGLSQSSGDPAVQGGVTVTHASGFYAGVWASSTKFDVLGAAPKDTYGHAEVDLIAGWSGPVSSLVTADVGLTYYAYPDGHAGKANFAEPYASLSATLGPVQGKLGAAYAWKQASLDGNADGKRDDSLYLYGELSGGVPNTPVSLAAHLGWTKGALSPRFLTRQTAAYDGGFDANLTASYALNRNLSAALGYHAVAGRAIDGYSNDTVVATLKFVF